MNRPAPLLDNNALLATSPPRLVLLDNVKTLIRNLRYRPVFIAAAGLGRLGKSFFLSMFIKKLFALGGLGAQAHPQFVSLPRSASVTAGVDVLVVDTLVGNAHYSILLLDCEGANQGRDEVTALIMEFTLLGAHAISLHLDHTGFSNSTMAMLGIATTVVNIIARDSPQLDCYLGFVQRDTNLEWTFCRANGAACTSAQDYLSYVLTPDAARPGGAQFDPVRRNVAHHFPHRGLHVMRSYPGGLTRDAVLEMRVYNDDGSPKSFDAIAQLYGVAAAHFWRSFDETAEVLLHQALATAARRPLSGTQLVDVLERLAAALNNGAANINPVDVVSQVRRRRLDLHHDAALAQVRAWAHAYNVNDPLLRLAAVRAAAAAQVQGALALFDRECARDLFEREEQVVRERRAALTASCEAEAAAVVAAFIAAYIARLVTRCRTAISAGLNAINVGANTPHATEALLLAAIRRVWQAEVVPQIAQLHQEGFPAAAVDNAEATLRNHFDAESVQRVNMWRNERAQAMQPTYQAAFTARKNGEMVRWQASDVSTSQVPGIVAALQTTRGSIRNDFRTALQTQHGIPATALDALTAPLVTATDAELEAFRVYLYELAARQPEIIVKEEGLYVNSHHMEKHDEKTIVIAANEQFRHAWAERTAWNADGGYMDGPEIFRDTAGRVYAVKLRLHPRGHGLFAPGNWRGEKLMVQVARKPWKQVY